MPRRLLDWHANLAARPRMTPVGRRRTPTLAVRPPRTRRGARPRTPRLAARPPRTRRGARLPTRRLAVKEPRTRRGVGPSKAQDAYGVDCSGHTSTTPCATAQGVLETRSTASSESGGLNDREPRDRKVRAQERPLAGVHARSVVIAHLHGLAGDTHQRSFCAQALIVSMGRIADRGLSPVIPSTISISDGHESRHEHLDPGPTPGGVMEERIFTLPERGPPTIWATHSPLICRVAAFRRLYALIVAIATTSAASWGSL